MRLFIIQRILGSMSVLTSTLMIVPILLSLSDHDGLAPAFILTALICAGLGFILWWPARHCSGELRLRDGFLVVTLIWLTVINLCTLPFLLMPIPLTWTHAFFEATSGLTTTGITSLRGLDTAPHSLLFYRQSLHFVGGMGIVILAIAVVPLLQIGGSQLFRAESSGAVKDARLTPRIAETAKALWLVYVSLNASCALAYWLGGMSFFDAVTHAFATMATGGFTNYDQSFGQFNSGLLQTMAIFFMFIAGINYALHFIAWRRATTQIYFSDSEVRAYFKIVLILVLVLTVGLWINDPRISLLTSFREASFHVVSNITTTGFINSNQWQWPGFTALLLILLGFVGGCSGSTAGGMKVVRTVILFRQAWREVLQLIHPRGRFLIKLGQASMPGAALAAITGFCTLYVACFIALTFMLSAAGLDLLSAFLATASCINNMGQGLGAIALDFSSFNDAVMWICSLAMIVGRLEVFTLLVLLSAAYWRE
jgi:trk system potassium uptake protein TrkH